MTLGRDRVETGHRLRHQVAGKLPSKYCPIAAHTKAIRHDTAALGMTLERSSDPCICT